MAQKTKIIATLGPSSDSLSTIKKMILAGMDVVRLNLSHNTYEYHEKLIENVRAAGKALDRPITIILDLQGPKLRVGEIVNQEISVKKNDEIVLVPESFRIPAKSAHLYIPVQFSQLYKYAGKKQTIYIDDASIKLEVETVKRKAIYCRVLNDGVIKSRKGLNLPGTDIKCPALSAKDLADVKFGIKNKVDFIALSYVKTGKDVLKLRQRISNLEKKFKFKTVNFKKLEEHGKWPGVHTRIIAKIEMPSAVKNFKEILDATDAVMIARGDLGIEIPLEDLPLIQKEMINKCLKVAKPVIVATQMLNSMITKPYPTRAEVSDVANAILDGADAVMLSGETATGKYPIKTVKIMDKIAHEVEPAKIDSAQKNGSLLKSSSITSAIAKNCRQLADQVNARAIVCTSTSGFTARFISSLKPSQPIVSLSPSDLTQRQLNLSWGVFPRLFNDRGSFDKFIVDLKKMIIKEKIAKAGEAIVICTGHPLGYLGQTNLIKVEIL